MSGTIRVQCPKCGKVLKAPPEAQGRRVECSGCSANFRIAGGSAKPRTKPAAPATSSRRSPAAPPAEKPAKPQRRPEPQRKAPSRKPAEPEVLDLDDVDVIDDGPKNLFDDIDVLDDVEVVDDIVELDDIEVIDEPRRSRSAGRSASRGSAPSRGGSSSRGSSRNRSRSAGGRTSRRNDDDVIEDFEIVGESSSGGLFDDAGPDEFGLDEFDDVDLIDEDPGPGRPLPGRRASSKKASSRERSKRLRERRPRDEPVPERQSIESKVWDGNVLGGLAMMAVAVIWFVLGASAGRIFFYPPILFFIGLVGMIRGLLE